MMDAKRIKRISTAQEKRTAKELGAGRTRPGSGAFDGMKGDVITGRAGTGFNQDDFLIENKFTFDSFYSLKLDTWNKIAVEALRENMRTPLMQIDITKGTPGETRIVVMDKQDFIAFNLKDHFPTNYFSTSTDAKSHRLQWNELFTKFSRNSMYREQVVFKKHRKILVILSLEDFKRCIAIY